MSTLRVAWLISVLVVSAQRMSAQMPDVAPAVTQASETSSPGTKPDDSSQLTATIHLTSRLVVLDIVVTDANGMPAHGLRPLDFNLSEDGIPQKLASFTEHGAAGLAGPAAPLPANTFAVQAPPTEDQPKTVIVLADPTAAPVNSERPQFPSGTAVNTGYVRDDIAAFLKTAPSTQPIAIVAWTGRACT